MTQAFGRLLQRMRDRWKIWRIVFFVILGILVGINVLIHPHHAEFGIDAYPGFWGVFGLVAGLAMVIIMKKIIQPLIARKEDFYER